MPKKKRQGLVIKEDKADGKTKKAKASKDAKDTKNTEAAVAAGSTGSFGSSAVAAGSGSPSAPLAPWLHDYSAAELEAAVAWLLWPMTPEDFFREYWEKKPLHLKRSAPKYYEGLFAKSDLDQELRQGKVRYQERLNLVRFEGKKIDLNKGSGIASFQEVQEAWKYGATLQVLHPQQFHSAVRATMAALERSFGALFGANAYVTPAGQQGLAPHYDDVEVFMLQLEGSKHWKLHRPPDDDASCEYPLPRTASRDFQQEELCELLMECVLQPGDLLYFPRGTVHSGIAEGGFSNHLTVSTYQGICWHSFLEKALAGALDKAAGEDPEFRSGLPLNFSHIMGSWYELGSESGPRESFRRKAKSLLTRLQEFIEMDEVCDEMAVDFMTQRLPPRPASKNPKDPKENSVGEGITAETKVKWLDPSAVRPMLSTDEETSEVTVLLFHSVGNDSGRHMCNAEAAEAEEVGCLRFEATTFLPALRALHAAGTDAVRCGDLPLDESDAIALCENLVEAGCLERA
eukprot:s171_g18.t1